MTSYTRDLRVSESILSWSIQDLDTLLHDTVQSHHGDRQGRLLIMPLKHQVPLDRLAASGLFPVPMGSQIHSDSRPPRLDRALEP